MDRPRARYIVCEASHEVALDMFRSIRSLLDSLGLRKHPRLRLFLKRTYCRMIDPFGRGHRLPLDIGISVHVPTYFFTPAWSNYEVDAMGACHGWLTVHPDGVLADVGCSIAIYSLMALQAFPRAKVYAFDADSISLKTSAEFCRFSNLSRLDLVHGFLTEKHSSGATLQQAIADTKRILSEPGIHAEPTEVRFLCLDRALPDEVIPRHSLDGLLNDTIPLERPLIIKIDVEGAELVVLRGASKLLLTHRPTLLLSVHPQFLPSFKNTPEDVAQFLREHGYRWTLLNSDHEEHWWCEPTDVGAKTQ
jgi:FkbM family methyltransferase